MKNRGKKRGYDFAILYQYLIRKVLTLQRFIFYFEIVNPFKQSFSLMKAGLFGNVLVPRVSCW